MTDPIAEIEKRHAAATEPGAMRECEFAATKDAAVFVQHAYADMATLIAEVKRLRNADDPLYDGTDAAHPAWWRGERAGGEVVVRAVTKILDGKDDGSGVMNASMEGMRRRLLALLAGKEVG